LQTEYNGYIPNSGSILIMKSTNLNKKQQVSKQLPCPLIPGFNTNTPDASCKLSITAIYQTQVRY
jgi:hypothetical protein